MRRTFYIAIVALFMPCLGCGTPWLAVRHPNPALVPVPDAELVHNALVDVLDDHFRIEREERVRLVRNPDNTFTMTMGLIRTWPEQTSTLAEPWRSDTVTFYDKLLATFQSYRKKAEVFIVPVQGGFNVQVNVFKELEDMPKPLGAASGSGFLRNETSQRHVDMAVGQQPTVSGWIPQGRDPNLEQKILNQLFVRLGIEPPWWMRGPRLYPVGP